MIQDTTIVVWDVVSGCGLFRLKGHKGPITGCRWLHHGNVLISSSKDTLVKLWDLDTQHCFQTLVNHRNEVIITSLLFTNEVIITSLLFTNEVIMTSLLFTNEVVIT